MIYSIYIYIYISCIYSIYTYTSLVVCMIYIFTQYTKLECYWTFSKSWCHTSDSLVPSSSMLDKHSKLRNMMHQCTFSLWNCLSNGSWIAWRRIFFEVLRSLQTLTTPEVKEEATSPGAPPASASPQPAGATEEQNSSSGRKKKISKWFRQVKQRCNQEAN